MGKNDDARWRAQKDAEIERLKKEFKSEEDSSVDSTSGTPLHKKYTEWLKAHTQETDWEGEASRDLDRHFDVRTPVIHPDQPRLPQTDCDLRLDIDRRITIREGDARRSHWVQHRSMLMEVRKRIVLPIDKEVIYSTAMIAQYMSDEETTEDVLKRRKDQGGSQDLAAD